MPCFNVSCFVWKLYDAWPFEAILMSTHNVCFYGEMWKILFFSIWVVLMNTCNLEKGDASINTENIKRFENSSLGLIKSVHERYCMGPLKRICVFEHSVMTNFNYDCPAIQRGQGSGFLSEGSSWLTACMSEQRRFWRDCADAQARLDLRCSHKR